MRFVKVLGEAWALFGPIELVALAAFVSTLGIWAATLAVVLR
jgi:hypothetical protein